MVEGEPCPLERSREDRLPGRQKPLRRRRHLRLILAGVASQDVGVVGVLENRSDSTYIHNSLLTVLKNL